MLAIVRKNKVLAHLEQNGVARTKELADSLGVVPETIRRDLEELEMQGLLRRVRGGAVTPSDGEVESPVFVRELTNSQIKNELCKAAAKYVQNDDFIFVDNSTTLLNLVRCLDDSKAVSLVTNSVRLLFEADRHNKTNVTMISIGGILSTYNMSLSGQLNEEFSNSLFPTKAFVSCTGFSLETGFTDTSVFEINAKHKMMSLATEVIVVMDHSKFEKRGLVKIGDLSICSKLIVDKVPDEAYRRRMLSIHPRLQIIEIGVAASQE
jgi:DeoR family fructose operon transcriptional repressor